MTGIRQVLDNLGISGEPEAVLERKGAFFALLDDSLVYQDDERGVRQVRLRDLTRIHSDELGILKIETPAGVGLSASLMGFDPAEVQPFFMRVRDATGYIKAQARKTQMVVVQEKPKPQPSPQPQAQAQPGAEAVDASPADIKATHLQEPAGIPHQRVSGAGTPNEETPLPSIRAVRRPAPETQTQASQAAAQAGVQPKAAMPTFTPTITPPPAPPMPAAPVKAEPATTDMHSFWTQKPRPAAEPPAPADTRPIQAEAQAQAAVKAAKAPQVHPATEERQRARAAAQQAKTQQTTLQQPAEQQIGEQARPKAAAPTLGYTPLESSQARLRMWAMALRIVAIMQVLLAIALMVTQLTNGASKINALWTIVAGGAGSVFMLAAADVIVFLSQRWSNTPAPQVTPSQAQNNPIDPKNL